MVKSFTTWSVIEIGEKFSKGPSLKRNKLRTFDSVVAKSTWNQDWFTEKDYDADELGRFPKTRAFQASKALIGDGYSTYWRA